MQNHIPCYGVGFLFQSLNMKKPSLKSLQARKDQFAEKLGRYELDNTVSDLELFDYTLYHYIDPSEVAERLLILLAVSFTAYNFNESEKVMNWLKKENLWKSVSDREKEFFRDPDPSDEDKQNLSWRFEGAYMLAWCLNKVDFAPRPESESSEQQVGEFLRNVPAVGSPTTEFFADLRYRSPSEILDETLFYQLAEKYFQSLVKDDKENTSSVHAKASIERLRVLSWLYSGSPDWDLIESGKGNI